MRRNYTCTLSCARFDHRSTTGVSRFFSDSNRRLDLTWCGTTACLARYYRTHCGTKTLLPLQPRYYRASHGTTATWSGTKILVPQALAVLPWITSISWQLSRILSMCFLCFTVVFALILFAFCACFAFVSQVVALAVPISAATRAPSVCAIQVKHRRALLPPSECQDIS